MDMTSFFKQVPMNTVKKIESKAKENELSPKAYVDFISLNERQSECEL